MNVIKELESLKRRHHYCEDPWYSCPKEEDGCMNELEGNECNCGADEDNIKIDELIKHIEGLINESRTK